MPTIGSQPLIVRLRHWVGDVVLGVPALRSLESVGHRLVLIGKPWAGALLAGEGWSVLPLPATAGERRRQLIELRTQLAAEDPGFAHRINMLLMPFSFSSAWEARRSGLRALGYRKEARRWLLARSIARVTGEHELESYWRLAGVLSGQREPPPRSIGLKLTAAARQAATQRLAAAGIDGNFIVMCPFAGGTFEGLDKRWPGFASLIAQAAAQWRLPIVLCPGPGEGVQIESAHATVLEQVPLDVYAAMLERCALMVSNDSGPGHLAAAVGAPLVSVLGPTDVRQWGPWGPSARVVQRPQGWPSLDEVLQAVQCRLDEPSTIGTDAGLACAPGHAAGQTGLAASQ
jgi:heptosyltransferase-2